MMEFCLQWLLHPTCIKQRFLKSEGSLETSSLVKPAESIRHHSMCVYSIPPMTGLRIPRTFCNLILWSYVTNRKSTVTVFTAHRIW